MGAYLFHKIQPWSILESLYFCFSSLGTIGFGDLSPKGNFSQYMASGYILIGMAVVAMCFSLIQTEIILWLRKFGLQDTVIASPSISDAKLLSIKAISQPQKSSWQRQNEFLMTESPTSAVPNFNSLPRRSSGMSSQHHNPFQRNTMIRRSTGVLDNHMEYFVPRSVSEFNLSGVGDLAIMPPSLKRVPMPNHPYSIQPLAQTSLHQMPKQREKMVTFEDESKCPHGIPTTPRKGPIVNDVFMWREGGWDYDEDLDVDVPESEKVAIGEVIKV